ncbi:MAG: hypothetical protein HY706_15110 [Candidatus Hydrogenedentes bacterium]|nr:hypothetical protein [Candidatus Hydrogenedentota bacterium]
MMKRFVLALIAIFVAWSVLDFLIHGVILMRTYEATAELWRPMEQMKMGIMRMVTLVVAAAFTGLYATLVSPKNLVAGLKFGLLFGVATGLSMGFGTYSVMPIPARLAVVWFVGTLAETTVAGALVGAIIRSPVLNGDTRP